MAGNNKSTLVHFIILSIIVSFFPLFSYSSYPHPYPHPHPHPHPYPYPYPHPHPRPCPPPHKTSGIATYIDGNPSALADACNSGYYKWIILGFFTGNGSDASALGQNHNLNIDITVGAQLSIEDDISACQAKGIKVLLSVGGPTSSFNLSSADQVTELADYLWNNFLGGNSSDFRPVGNATLDGIDLFIRSGSNEYYDDLARALSSYSTPEQKVYLSASPQCPIPDPYLDSAIQTKLFDYVWVNFYNNSQCDYRGSNVTNILDSWKMWTTRVVKKGRVLMGLPASPAAATGGGYMPPHVLISQVLPVIKRSPQYGGVMVWNYFYDQPAGFSAAIANFI